MGTVQFALVSVTLLLAVSTEDWAGCPEGTKFDGWADIISNNPCYNGGVRSDSGYTKGTLPYPVCCAPAGRDRRAAELELTGLVAEANVKATERANTTARTA